MSALYAYMALSATTARYARWVPGTSAWDRQRSAVRSELTQTAITMFIERGFDTTTIDEIVAAVGVSRRTFFRYFGTKEDVVLGDLADRGAIIAKALAARPADEDPWEALRSAYISSGESTALDDATALAIGRMLLATPSLRARLHEKRRGWHDAFVPIIAERMGEPHGRRRATAIVAAALACLDTASELWIAADGDGSLLECYDDAVAAIRA